jgi:hypothetical protein
MPLNLGHRPRLPVNRNAPAASRRPGRGAQPYYLAVDGVVVFFFLLCFLAGFEAVEGEAAAGAPAAGASAAIGAAVFGMSAAIAPAAIPIVNKAEVIKVPDLFMGSPAVV